MMTSLPVLIKKPKAKYVVGADLCSHGKGEVLTFCVVEIRDGEENTFITQQGSIANDKKGEWEDQIRTLNEFFNTKTLMERR